MKGGRYMMNQVVLVGRIVYDPELHETESGLKVTTITLAVPRAYKNPDGEYETDFIKCVIWRGIAENVAEYVKRGDLVGIKGRIQMRIIDDEAKNQIMEIIADKVSFLSSKPKEVQEAE